LAFARTPVDQEHSIVVLPEGGRMRKLIEYAILVPTLSVAVAVLGAQYAPPTPPGQPAWAYAIPSPVPPTPAAAPATPDTTPRTLPGSDKTFTRAQISDAFGPADWYPNDHPPMPDVVAKGRRPDVRACGLCHMPNGKGRPENAGVSGLPPAYFIQQIHDFRSDVRKSSDPRKTNANTMIAIAKAMTEDEIRQAADYFGAIKWSTRYIRVVETSTVPKTRLQGGVHLVLEDAAAGTEPIGQRIVESPEHAEHFEVLRDPHDGFVAYVPPGSIKKGEALVRTGGNGRTVACGTCHGEDLQGLGPVPPIAGRSPSYIARQMWDIQQGARKGLWADLMKRVVQKLTNEDLVNIAAYTASRPVTSVSAN
jgi:cytochrome c553